MDCIFNELSLEEEISSKIEAINLMIELIYLCKEINRLCKRPKMKLRAIENLRQKELSIGYTVQDWLSDKNVDREYQRLLYTLLDSPTVNEAIVREEEYMAANFKYIDNDIEKESDGLGVAYTTGKNGVLTLSLNSHPRWNTHEIALLHFYNNQQEKITVKHASQKDHLDKNKSFILIIKSGDFNLPTLDDPFPNLIQSNKLVNNDWHEFKQRLDKSPKQKLSNIQAMADDVATINGYIFNNDLSSLNQRKRKAYRKIYEAGEGRNKVYLSVDFEKGRFELCNYAGIHQGEYKFDGEKSGKSQADHGIIIT
jgi:hypothetical protein